MKGLLMKDTHVIREDQQIKVLTNKIKNAIKIIKSKKLEPSFEPSMNTLSRIMKTMTEKGSKGKTQMSLDTRLNYARLAKHIVWLEKKSLVESTIEDNKINISLTRKGKEFASIISE